MAYYKFNFQTKLCYVIQTFSVFTVWQLIDLLHCKMLGEGASGLEKILCGVLVNRIPGKHG